MKIKFKKIKLKAEELYEGVIRKVEFDKVSRRVTGKKLMYMWIKV